MVSKILKIIIMIIQRYNYLIFFFSCAFLAFLFLRRKRQSDLLGRGHVGRQPHFTHVSRGPSNVCSGNEKVISN